MYIHTYIFEIMYFFTPISLTHLNLRTNSVHCRIYNKFSLNSKFINQLKMHSETKIKKIHI